MRKRSVWVHAPEKTYHLVGTVCINKPICMSHNFVKLRNTLDIEQPPAICSIEIGSIYSDVEAQDILQYLILENINRQVLDLEGSA